MKLYEIKRILKAQTLVEDAPLDIEINAAGGADLMGDVLSSVAEGAVLLTGLTTEEVIRTAKLSGVRAIVFVRGKEPSPKIVELAKKWGLLILLTKYSLFVACGRLYLNGLRGLDGSW